MQVCKTVTRVSRQRDDRKKQKKENFLAQSAIGYKKTYNFKDLISKRKYSTLRKLCSNPRDPITLEDLPMDGKGLIYIQDDNGTINAFFPDPLARYIYSSGMIQNPLTRKKFDRGFLEILDKLTSVSCPKIIPLQKDIECKKKKDDDIESLLFFLINDVLDVLGELEEWMRLSNYMEYSRYINTIKELYIPSFFVNLVKIYESIRDCSDRKKHIENVHHSIRTKILSIGYYKHKENVIIEKDFGMRYMMMSLEFMEDVASVLASYRKYATLKPDTKDFYSEVVVHMPSVQNINLKEMRISVIKSMNNIPADVKNLLISGFVKNDREELSLDDLLGITSDEEDKEPPEDQELGDMIPFEEDDDESKNTPEYRSYFYPESPLILNHE